MAVIDTNRSNPTRVLAGAFGFRRLIDAVVAWNESRVTRAALSKLSDRELEDIGLNRRDIDFL